MGGVLAAPYHALTLRPLYFAGLWLAVTTSPPRTWRWRAVNEIVCEGVGRSDSRTRYPARFNESATTAANSRERKRRSNPTMSAFASMCEGGWNGAMRSLVRFFLLFLFPLSVVAQPLRVGPALPLTNTRYAPYDAPATIASNGEQNFAFTYSTGHVRVTPVAYGAKRVSRPVVQSECCWQPTVLWTGERFLTFGSRGRMILGQFLDRNAYPIALQRG